MRPAIAWQTAGMAASSGEIRFGTPAARWVIAATVLGSGIAFLDGTIVNVALPAIGRDLKTDVAGLQWTIDAYLVTAHRLVAVRRRARRPLRSASGSS